MKLKTVELTESVHLDHDVGVLSPKAMKYLQDYIEEMRDFIEAVNGDDFLAELDETWGRDE